MGGAQVFYYHQATNTTSTELPVVNGAGSQHRVGLDSFEMHTAMPTPNAMQAVTPRTEPLLPTDAAAAGLVDDKAASKRGWFLHFLSLACCCFCHGVALLFSPLVWV